MLRFLNSQFSLRTRSGDGKYQLLAPSGVDSGETDQGVVDIEKEESEVIRLHSSRPSRLTIFACVIALLSTLLNIFVSFYPRSSPPPPKVPTKYLKRPSQFIGLSSLYSEAPDRSQLPDFGNVTLTTFPSIVQVISSKEPTRVFFRESSDPGRRFSRFGTISPEDRRVLVNRDEGISTIVQFRVRDYGMERCRLGIWLDPLRTFSRLSVRASEFNADRKVGPAFDQTMEKTWLGSSDSKGFLNSTRRKDWFLHGDVSELKIWKLENEIPPSLGDQSSSGAGYEGYKFGWVDPWMLSYRSRPRRMSSDVLDLSSFAEMQTSSVSLEDSEPSDDPYSTGAAPESEEEHELPSSSSLLDQKALITTPEFRCSEDEILTFELACDSMSRVSSSGPNCILDLWQDKKTPILVGVVLLQASTL